MVCRLGVAKVPGVLSRSAAKELFNFVLDELPRCRRKVLEDPTLREEFFTPGVYQKRARGGAPQTRWDLRLPLTRITWSALREALFEGACCLNTAFQSLVGGLESELWELAVLVSLPGAAPQLVHTDTDYSPGPCLFTAFVALQDVSYDMGPTFFLPGTHSNDAHNRFEHDPTALLRETVPAIALLEAGDAALYDGRVLHCGGANRSHEPRALLTITFRHVWAPTGFDNEDTRSIRPAYKSLKLRLRHFSKAWSDEWML